MAARPDRVPLRLGRRVKPRRRTGKDLRGTHRCRIQRRIQQRLRPLRLDPQLSANQPALGRGTEHGRTPCSWRVPEPAPINLRGAAGGHKTGKPGSVGGKTKLNSKAGRLDAAADWVATGASTSR